MNKIKEKYRQLYDTEQFEDLINIIDKKNDLSHEEMILKAIGHIEQGQYSVAESLLQQVLNEDEDTVTAFYLLGKIKYKLGDFASAVGCWRDALGSVASCSNPKMISKINLGLGMAYIKLGKEQEGINFLDKCLDIDPDEHRCYVIYAEFLIERNDCIKAEKIIRKGLAHFANSPEYYYYLCNIAEKQGQEAKAKKFAKRAQKLNNRYHTLGSEHLSQLKNYEN